MGFRFRMSKRIAPGVRLNVGKKSGSISLGGRGARLTAGTRGTRATVGIPGSGLSYTAKVGHTQKKRSPGKKAGPSAAATGARHAPGASYSASRPLSTTALVLWLVLFFPVGLVLMWTRSAWSQDTRWAVSGAYCWPLWWWFVRRTEWSRNRRGLVAAALVGGYVLVFTPAAPVALLCIGIPGFIWAMRSRQPEAAPESESTVSASAPSIDEIEAKLTHCDTLVCDIERSVVIDLLPADSSGHALYHQGLQLRSQGAEILGKSASEQDLARADLLLTRASVVLEEARKDMLR